VKRETLRAFRADTGQLLQLLNELRQRIREQSEAGNLQAAHQA
jgi:hypothetical protein